MQFSRQVFKVSDFLSWQRSGSLILPELSAAAGVDFRREVVPD